VADDGLAKRPIIVIKKKAAHGGHHGGAWKVAYADFVTAMMSLFIVLWLLNSTPQIQKAVGGYFNDPRGQASKTGTDNLGAGSNISIDKSTVEALKAKIQKAIMQQKNLEQLAKQVEITITGEGLRVELIEGKGGTFFETGSAKLNENGVQLLALLADQLKGLPNRLTIEGHTDAQPYSGDLGYTNWELSTDRANSARRVLQQHGMEDSRFAQVRGFADQMPRAHTDPMDASNRRVTLIVQWVELPGGKGEETAAGGATTKPEPQGAAEQSGGGAAGAAKEKAEGSGAPDAAKNAAGGRGVFAGIYRKACGWGPCRAGNAGFGWNTCGGCCEGSGSGFAGGGEALCDGCEAGHDGSLEADVAGQEEAGKLSGSRALRGCENRRQERLQVHWVALKSRLAATTVHRDHAHPRLADVLAVVRDGGWRCGEFAGVLPT
jgi:chemotaxis protein MotB